MNKKIVLLTGAGMSAESGLKTFRDNNGLWENHNIYEVATPNAWQKNPELVLAFYNQRRKQLENASPNDGHRMIAQWEKDYHVTIITQNVDDLHERAGSTNILHLHGELTKIRCSKDHNHIKDIGYEPLNIGDLCPDGHQNRPHIVWFEEAVPSIPKAAQIVAEADILVIIGTSMQVYPAAGLHQYSNPDCPIFNINPDDAVNLEKRIINITKGAIEGLSYFSKKILPSL